MRAIILAAGIGQRLAETHGGRPKCLLEFGGRSLLRRHIELLRKLGVAQLDLVLGYRADDIHQHLAELGSGLMINLRYNRNYEQGSVLSLSAAGDALCAGDEVLLMDADVLYSPRILQRLVSSSYSDCCLIDREFEPGDEPVKICLREQRIVEFRKRLSDLLRYDSIGESVGFFRFSAPVARALARQAGYYRDAGLGMMPHEEAIRDLILAAPERFFCEDVSGEPWIEIDYPEDVDRARDQVQPAVDAIRL